MKKIKSPLKLLPYLIIVNFYPVLHAQDIFSVAPSPTVTQNFVFPYAVNASLNGVVIKQPFYVQFRHDGYYVQFANLPKVMQRHLPRQSGWINLSQQPNVHVHYNAPQQRLNIEIPLNWLPEQSINFNNSKLPPYSISDGAVLNYDSYYSYISEDTQSLSTSLNLRLFNSAGYFIYSGILTNEYNGHVKQQRWQSNWVRENTSWVENNPNNDTTLILGDFVTQPDGWYSSVRMGGISYYKNYDLSPNIDTYPLPTIKGSAAVPTSVDLFLNGEKISSHNINSGPFTLSDIPFISGAGTATVVMKDKFGRTISSSIALYNSTSLLRAGLSRYDVNLGLLRYDYGSMDSKYATLAFSGSYHYGLSNSTTLATHTELAKHFVLLGAGVDQQLANFGILNLSLSHSELNQHQIGNSNRFAIGYSYQNSYFNFSYQHTLYGKHYRDLSLYNLDGDPVLSKESDNAVVSFNLPQHNALGIGYFYVHPYNSQTTSLLNLSLSNSNIMGGSVTISVSRNFSSNNNVAMLSLSLPLGSAINSNLSTSYNKQQFTSIAAISHHAVAQNGVDWSMSYQHISHSQMRFSQAQLNWKNSDNQLQAGLYNFTEPHPSAWMELSGSVGWLDGHLLFAQDLSDPFILVDTNGMPNIPFYNNNLLIGKTNQSGFGFISDVQPNNLNTVSIDPAELPADQQLTHYQQQLNIAPYSGAVVKFGIHSMTPVLLTIKNAQGADLPVGSVLNIKGQSTPSFIGYDGQAYLNYLGHAIQATVQYGHQQCHFDYAAKHPSGKMILATVTCE